MTECDKCGKEISESEFYCYLCKQKEIKKIKQNAKVRAKRTLESEIVKFEEYLKSGRRTY